MIYDDVVYVDGVAKGRICRRHRRQNVVYFKVHLVMFNVVMGGINNNIAQNN